MEIKLTSEESEKYFLNALCNGLQELSGYGCSLEYDDIEYKEAKARLCGSKPTAICLEDVLMEILQGGGTLTWKDEQGGEYTRSIKLKDVHERVCKTPLTHLVDMVNEADDAVTADVILQQVFLNEIVFS